VAGDSPVRQTLTQSRLSEVLPETPMKVLITATSLNLAYGGPAFSVSSLASALARAGADVGVWSADGSALETQLIANGVARLGGTASEAAAAMRPDLVHDNGIWLTHNHRVAALAAQRGVPRLVSTRGMLEPWAVRHKRWKKAAAWRVYQRRDLDQAAMLHATAPQEAQNLAALRLRPPIAMIPNGVDVPRTAPARSGGGVRTALFLGRIYPVKGLPTLIDAWAQAQPEDWRLVIAGPDEAGHQREVEAAVAAAGLEDVVSFPGPVFDDEAKTALLHSADLFVLPSLSESFGMAIAEALAHGVPVVTTTAVPWPQLEARQCGWRAAPEAEALAEVLGRATGATSETLQAMGAAGRELIAAEFGWPKIAAEFLSLYERLVQDPTAEPQEAA